MSQFFLLGSSLLTFASVFLYFRQVVNGSSVPNPSTWFLWASISLMNAVSYFFVVQENLWQSLYVIIYASGITLIFFYSLFRGKFARFGTVDTICFVLAVLVAILWKTTDNADIANIALQLTYLISVAPTIVGLLNGKLKEKAFPWNLAVASHVFAALGIITSSSFSLAALVYPLVTGVIGNGSVALVASLRARNKEV